MPIAYNEQTGEALALSPDGQWAPTKLATNPQTGERVAFDGTDWRPVGTSAPHTLGPSGATWNGVDNFSSGVLQGLGDELKAGAQAVKAQFTGGPSFGDAYDQALAAYQGARSKYKEDNPNMALATDLAGQMAPWLVAAPLLPGAAGATWLARAGKGLVTGATIGGVSGGLNAEGDLADRGKGALIGAGTGAVLGGITPPVVDVLGKGLGWAADQTVNRLPFRQASAAARKLAEALGRDGMTPDEATARVAQMGPSAAVIDAGPNTQSLGRSVYTVPGEGKTAIGDFLTARQEGTRDANNVLQGGQAGRVTDAINDLVPDSFSAAKKAVADRRQALGAAYEAARASNAGVDISPVLADLDAQLQYAKGGIKSGLDKVRSYLVDSDGNPETNIEALHNAKMAIDDLMSGGGDSSMGRVTRSQIRDVQDGLIDAIEKVSPDYRTGRLGTSAAWRVDEALDNGRQFMLNSVSGSPEEMAARIAKMSPEEQDALRTGAAQALKSRVADTNVRTDVTKKLMDIPALEQKIRSVFGDDDLFRRYIDGLQNERQMFNTYGKTIGGSRTGEVLAEQADSKADPGRLIMALQRMSSGEPTNMLGGAIQAVGALKNRVTMPAPMGKQLARLLLSPDASGLNQAFKSNQLSDVQRRALVKALSITDGVLSGRAQGQ